MKKISKERKKLIHEFINQNNIPIAKDIEEELKKMIKNYKKIVKNYEKSFSKKIKYDIIRTGGTIK